MSEPQPDLSLLTPRADHYRESHPTGLDTLLVVEVSDSTLRYDRDVKLPVYARHGVPEVWIVDLQNGCVHFHRELSLSRSVVDDRARSCANRSAAGRDGGPVRTAALTASRQPLAA
jgi:Uma2 family endonuclease